MLSHALRAKVQNTALPVPTDPNFKQVSLLLHGDGTNGAQNNTFLDSSTNNFTVTRNGNTTQGTNTPFSQAAGAWSNYFGGSNYFTLPSNAAFALDGGNFTFEFWIYLNAYTTGDSTSIFFSTNNLQNIAIGGTTNNAGRLVFYDGGFVLGAAGDVPLNAWTHIALVRNGTTVTFYKNGTNVASSTLATTSPPTQLTFIGANGSGATPINGYLSNLRIVKGTAVYTSAFTPSTTPLTAITNTSLLTCQSNYFKDNSSNNFTVTATGTPSVQPFSPFAPTAAYSTSVNGGSITSNGFPSYLYIPSCFAVGTNNFTVEGWFNYPVVSNNGGVFGSIPSTTLTNGQFGVGLTGATSLYTIQSNSGGNRTVPTIYANTWHHIAYVRNSGVGTWYLDGVSFYSVADTYNYTDANMITNGFYNSDGVRPITTSNIRIVNGTAVYTATFTPPTAPLTAITNTSLLLSGTNAGIFDNAIKNNLETVGNAQVSTSVTKFGTGSVYIPAGGALANYVTTPNSPQFDLGTGDFTIEFWYNAGTNVANTGVLSKGWGGGGFAPFLFYHTGTALQFYSSSNNSSWDIVSAANIISSVSTNTWYHVAVTRQGSSIRTFSNGTLISTTTSSAKLLTNTSPVTMNYHTAASQGTTYIDDLRITKGVARYTANFTPPTQAFPNQ